MVFKDIVIVLVVKKIGYVILCYLVINFVGVFILFR